MADVTEPDTATHKAASHARSSRSQETLEDQVAKLEDDIKSIAASLARLGDDKVSETRGAAKAQYKNLVKSGKHVVDDLQSQAGAFESQITDAIREKPLTAVAGAIGIGFLIALLTRR